MVFFRYLAIFTAIICSVSTFTAWAKSTRFAYVLKCDLPASLGGPIEIATDYAVVVGAGPLRVRYSDPKTRESVEIVNVACIIRDKSPN